MQSVPDGGPTLQLSRASAVDLTTIPALAREIWSRVYPGIISREQIDYMLARMYAIDVLREEVDSRSIAYWRLLVDGEARGYAACGPGDAPGEVFLHKLYLHPDFHGRGLGSAALAGIESAAREEFSAQCIVLRVNKRNRRAIDAYARNGYRVSGEVCSDIGGGFVMDDYWMRKELPCSHS